MSEKIVYLTEETYEEVLGAAKAAVVDFYADWCGPCKSMLPLYDALAEAYDGKVVFCKINVDEHKKLAIQNRVMGIPCFLFFKEGKQVARQDGTMGETDFRKMLDSLL